MVRVLLSNAPKFVFACGAATELLVDFRQKMIGSVQTGFNTRFMSIILTCADCLLLVGLYSTQKGLYFRLIDNAK